MKKSDIYEIAIKILGIYLFFTCINLLRDVFLTLTIMLESKQNPAGFGDFIDSSLFFMSLGNFLFVALFAYFLTFKTGKIVSLVCKPSDYEEQAKLFAERRVIYEMALVIMGLLLIVWTLPELVLDLKNYMQQKDRFLPRVEGFMESFIPEITQLILGLTGTFFARSISRFLIRQHSKKKD